MLTLLVMVETSRTRRRHVVLPAAEKTRGRLWSYGVRTLAEMVGKSANAVRDHIQRGDFDPADLSSVLRWVSKQAPAAELPGKGWQPVAPRLSDAVIATLIASSARLVRSARERGHFDPKDALSLAAWIHERRRWAKPVPSRQFERHMLVELPAQPELPVVRGASARRSARRRKRSLQAVRQDLQALGFTNAEVRGEAHIFVRPDFLPLPAAERLVAAMNAAGLRASDVTRRQRRRLALGFVSAADRG